MSRENMLLGLWPSRKQWRTWSLPSKLTAIGALIGVVSLLVMLAISLLQRSASEPSKDRASAPEPTQRRSLLPLDELISLGDEAFTANKYEAALDYYARALNIDPGDAKTWRKNGLAHIGLAMGDTDFRFVLDNCQDARLEYFMKALRSFDRALAIDSEDKESYLYRGIVYYRWGNLHPILGPPNNTQNAFSQFEAATKLILDRPNIDPQGWDNKTSCAYYGMAKVFCRLSKEMGSGLLDDANEYLTKAKGTFPCCIPPDSKVECRHGPYPP